MTKKKIAIVGGGITGLYLGYRLGAKNKVTIFEKKKALGGLLSSFSLGNNGWAVDNFYHHFFPSDKNLISLLKELSLPYSFSKPTSAIWHNGKISRFSSPADLIAFPNLGLINKLRFGATIALAKLIPNYHLIPDQKTKKIFLPLGGKKAYQVVWEPLMRGKFGPKSEQISAIWLWARIKKRSARLGYPKGGFITLNQKLAQEIINQGGQIKTKNKISQIKQLENFDQIIFTTPKAVFNQITKQKRTDNIDYLASLNLVLSGKEPILNNNLYWLSIADASFPFVAVVNQAGLVDKKNYHNLYPTYIGGYYQQDDPLLAASPQEILARFAPFIKKINPRFEEKNFQAKITKYRWAQPIVEPGYQKKRPAFKTKWPNTYLVNMAQIYPWDRGVNYAIFLADQFLKTVAFG
ncbi:MAG: FAD-dependent oxidoreductase [Patescibacteria group bacterium]|jgi:protoporphyrinogen oxidase